MTLPQVTNHPFSSPEDFVRMLALLQRSRTPRHSYEYPTAADYHELLAQSNVQANTSLWLDPDGAAAAFALVDPYNNLLFEIDPQASSLELDQEILAWGMACLSRRAQPGRPYPALDSSCSDRNKGRIAWLERYGFVRQAVQTLNLERDLNDGLPAPSLPVGFKLRTLHTRTEIQEWVDLHKIAHGTGFMSLAERQAMMVNPGYDAKMDLVIEAPDGRLAAYCVCTIDHANNQRTGRKVGATDPIATHPDFQRRGLAFALLLAGMALHKERGMNAAEMSITSANLPMLAAASKAGFRIVSRKYWFSRTGK